MFIIKKNLIILFKGKAMKKTLKIIFAIFIISAISYSCKSSDDYYYLKKSIPAKSKVAVLIRGNNQVKNAVFIEFMQAGYQVKAVNASDFYTTKDVFDIKDFRRVAYIANIKANKTQNAASLFDKMFNNIYKLHIYNFENSKAEIIKKMRDEWQIDYIILLSMDGWENGYSWSRAIDLQTMDLIYVHNYPAQKSDSYQSIIRKMIKTIQGAPSSKKAK